jgi:hypothetical protein
MGEQRAIPIFEAKVSMAKMWVVTKFAWNRLLYGQFSTRLPQYPAHTFTEVSSLWGLPGSWTREPPARPAQTCPPRDGDLPGPCSRP